MEFANAVFMNSSTLIILNFQIGLVLFVVPDQEDRAKGKALQYFRGYFLFSAVGFISFGLQILAPEYRLLAVLASDAAFLGALYLLHAGFCVRNASASVLLRTGVFSAHALLLAAMQTAQVMFVDLDWLGVLVSAANFSAIHVGTLLVVGRRIRRGNLAERFSWAALVYALFAVAVLSPLSYLLAGNLIHYYDSMVLTQLSTQVVLLGGIYASYLYDAVERHYEESMTDAMTGLHNRRYFHDAARRLLSSASRHDFPVSVIIADIDHFKKVNDTYGHDVGDRALQAFARSLLNAVRTEDVLARFGGEEFVVLLPRTGAAQACQVAERMREACAGIRVPTRRGEVSFTASFGVASVDDFTDVDVAVKLADSALYRAKADGRNRVTLADSSPGGESVRNLQAL